MPRRCYAYLEAAVALAREQWTQFGQAAMLAGLALFAATLALQAAAALGGPTSRPAAARGGGDGGAVAALGRQLQAWQVVAPWRPGSRVWVPTLRGWLGGLALVHSAGVFSFFYLLGEGEAPPRAVAAVRMFEAYAWQVDAAACCISQPPPPLRGPSPPPPPPPRLQA